MKRSKKLLLAFFVSFFLTLFFSQIHGPAESPTYQPNECFEGFDPSDEGDLDTFTWSFFELGFPFKYISFGGCTTGGRGPVPPPDEFRPLPAIGNLVFYGVGSYMAIGAIGRRRKRNEAKKGTAKESAK